MAKTPTATRFNSPTAKFREVEEHRRRLENIRSSPKHSLGCFANNHLPSSDPASAQLEKPQGTTYFAGDYMSHLVGSQEGAILSAHHAIERIAARIKA